MWGVHWGAGQGKDNGLYFLSVSPGGRTYVTLHFVTLVHGQVISFANIGFWSLRFHRMCITTDLPSSSFPSFFPVLISFLLSFLVPPFSFFLSPPPFLPAPPSSIPLVSKYLLEHPLPLRHRVRQNG